jgi:hypothetical protein
MPPDSPCPAREELERLLSGQVAAPRAERLEEHVRECPACAAAARTCHGQDTLVKVLRRAASVAVEGPEDDRVERLVELLTALPRPGAAGEAGPAPTAADCLAPAEGPGEIGRLGSYRVLHELGSGGMGVVFLAEDLVLRRQVALKVMHLALAATPGACERFLREARATAALSHDHVVRIHQVGEDRGVSFLAMELLRGETLAARLQRAGRPPLDEVVRLGREIVAGLAAAHAQGLIHRDVKPANVWLEADIGRVKLLDFGLARVAGEDAFLTQPGMIVGTPAYMAPEQAGGRRVDARGDLFSLGCVLYELCTGHVPFPGAGAAATLLAVRTASPPTPRQVNRQIPAALSDLVMRLLAKDPAQRPATAEGVARELGALDLRPRGAARAKQLALAAGLAVAGALAASWFAPTVLRLVPGGREPASRLAWPAEALRDGKVLAPALAAAKPLFKADFKDGPNGFPQREGKDEREDHGYANGRYFVEVRSGQYYWDCPGPSRSNFACQVIGRVADGKGGWTLDIRNPENHDRGVQITVFADGNIQVAPSAFEPHPFRGPFVGPTAHPAVKRGTAFNALLVVLRDRLLEVYVNGVAVCDPVEADRSITPAVLALGCRSERETRRAEFQQVTVWSAESLPRPEARGATWVSADRPALPPQAVGMRLVLDDPLRHPNGPFCGQRFKNADAEMGYDDGGYFMWADLGGPGRAWSCPCPGRFSNFACQVVGRVRGQPEDGWGLTITDPDGHGLCVRLTRAGTVQVERAPANLWPKQDHRNPAVGPLRLPAVKGGDELDTLLAVLHGRRLEVYVNSVAVCEPIVLDRDFTPSVLTLAALPRSRGMRAEFTRFTVWSADDPRTWYP